MTSLNITDADIPSLEGKTALITGGASGIGYEAVRLMASKGARVLILDLNEPDDGVPEGCEFLRTDATSWTDLKAAFKAAGPRVDIAVANAGVLEEENFFEDRFDEATGELLEPKTQRLVDVDFRGVVNFLKLAIHAMKKQEEGGSIVVTTSSTAYTPEFNLPIFSAIKLGTVGLVRSLRSSLPAHNISINGVAPAATMTKLLPLDLAKPIMAAGLPVCKADFVGRAIVYAATASQKRIVAQYGKDTTLETEGKWNGRIILTMGEDYTELEEPYADMRPAWYGWKNSALTFKQQATSDWRQL